MILQLPLSWICELHATVILGQQVTVDIVENFLNTWNNLLETGQLWAFLVGIGVGWWVRSVL